MNEIKLRCSISVLAIALAGCVSQFDCASSLCGCYKKRVETVIVELTDIDENPIANARLRCNDSDAYLGTTNDKGVLELQVPGSVSPGCGFIADCRIAFFETEDNGRGRPFWFARLVRGEEVGETDEIVSLVDRKK